MNCDEYLPLISGHLDGENSEFEERRLQEHLQICEDCRALLSLMEQNDALLKDSTAEPPADLTDRIMRQVRKEKQPKESTKRRWIPAAASGLAAAALLALVFWGNLPVVKPSKDAVKAEGAVYTEAPAETVKYSGEDVYSYASLAEDSPETSVVTDAAALTNAPADQNEPIENPADDLEGKGLTELVPDFPLYGTETVTVSGGTENDGSLHAPTETGPRRTGLHYTQSAPMLIVWGAGSLTVLEELEPEDLNEFAPLSAKLAPSLYERYQAVLPLVRDFDQISPAEGYGIAVFTVPYETMMEAFKECAGVYENAIYYPASFTAPDECVIVLVDFTE